MREEQYVKPHQGEIGSDHSRRRFFEHAYQEPTKARVMVNDATVIVVPNTGHWLTEERSMAAHSKIL
jgi:hypothetical protein